MMVFYSLQVQTGGKVEDSPPMGAGDVARLKDLFPNNPVWKAEVRSGNLHIISMEQAQALYKEMVKHYVENDISDEPYQTGNSVGSIAVTSDLLSLFDELLGFFEKTLGFTSSKEDAKVITEKQQARQDLIAWQRAEIRECAEKFFGKLAPLKPPSTDEIRVKLERKLEQYERRCAKYAENLPPSFAFRANPRVRDAVYKILVVEAVLGAESDSEINLRNLAIEQLDKHGDVFDGGEFWQACAVVAVYLGTPYGDSQIANEEPVVC